MHKSWWFYINYKIVYKSIAPVIFQFNHDVYRSSVAVERRKTADGASCLDVQSLLRGSAIPRCRRSYFNRVLYLYISPLSRCNVAPSSKQSSKPMQWRSRALVTLTENSKQTLCSDKIEKRNTNTEYKFNDFFHLIFRETYFSSFQSPKTETSNR